MSVYVDSAKMPYRNMIMCHMIADTTDELHKMAIAIGIQTKWFQKDASFPHYDISSMKRKLAVKAGAIECDRATFVGHMRRIRGEV